jgi:(p)ppGpp synthase/HD superfamily hydrolase
MGVLSPPRSSGVNAALSIARELGMGRTIDGAPPVRHAVRVVVVLERYVPVVDEQLAAGIILHDTPYFTEDRTALDTRIRDSVGAVAADIVTSIETEHRFMGQAEGTSDVLIVHLHALAARPDPTLLLATIADKITSFESIIGRSEKAPCLGDFWRARLPLARRLAYFRQAHTITASRLPAAMAEAYDRLVARLEREVGSAFAEAGIPI